MARKSKIALLVTAALAILAMATGPVVAGADAHATSTGQGIPSAVYAVADSQDPGTELSADRSRSSGDWQRGPGRRLAPPADAFGERSDYWSAGEVLQWIAIAALAGFAVALLIWRPWRPRRDSEQAGWRTGPADAPAVPVATAPAAQTQPTAASPDVSSPNQDTTPEK